MSCPIEITCPDGSTSTNCNCQGWYYPSCIPGWGGSGDKSQYLFAEIEAGDTIIFSPCGSNTNKADQYTSYYISPADPPYSWLGFVTESM